MAPAQPKVATGSSSQPHPNRIAQPSMRTADCPDNGMSAQWGRRTGRVLFPEVLPGCNGRQPACERPLDGLRSPSRVSTQAQNMGRRPQPGVFGVRYGSHTGLNNSDITPCPFAPISAASHTSSNPRLSYIRVQRPECRQNRSGYVDGFCSKDRIRRLINAGAGTRFNLGAKWRSD